MKDFEHTAYSPLIINEWSLGNQITFKFWKSFPIWWCYCKLLLTMCEVGISGHLVPYPWFPFSIPLPAAPCHLPTLFYWHSCCLGLQWSICQISSVCIGTYFIPIRQYGHSWLHVLSVSDITLGFFLFFLLIIYYFYIYYLVTNNRKYWKWPQSQYIISSIYHSMHPTEP